MLQVTELVASVGLMVLIFSHTLGLHSQEENADRGKCDVDIQCLVISFPLAINLK